MLVSSHGMLQKLAEQFTGCRPYQKRAGAAAQPMGAQGSAPWHLSHAASCAATEALRACMA